MNMEALAINKKISRNRDFKKECTEKKLNVINWSISLSGQTTQGNYDTHWIWTSDDGRYRVGFAKNGKEFYSNTIRRKDGTLGNNENDMRPIVEKDGKIINFDPSFDNVFEFFQYIQMKCGDNILNAVGCMMVRNAYMQDHVNINGNYYYLPDKSIINIITEAIPEYNGICTEAYLHYIDAIAQNEDTKYHTLGHDVSKGAGRHNNILTYAHIAAVLLRKAPLSKLCASFARPPIGVAPIPFNVMVEAFPLLKIE
jgi:hypothetical protein